MMESTLVIFINLLLFMLSLAVIGEPLRFLLRRISRFFKNLDILQVLVLDLYLGGLILYVIAMIPLHLFNFATIWLVLLFSVFFVIVELVVKQHRLPKKCDAVRYVVVLGMFLVSLWILLMAISDLVFGSIHDTSLHSLFVQLLLENGQAPVTLQPYAAEGIVYPQVFHPIVAFMVCISNCLVPRAVLLVTSFFSATSVLGAYYLGKASSSRWHFSVALAFVFTFIASYPKYITWGSNALVASIPLYFICLSFIPSLLKKGAKVNAYDIISIGIPFGYLAAMHPQPFEVLAASIILLWFVGFIKRKRSVLSQLRYILPILFLSMIPVSPFFYRWLIWYSYPYHNIGLPEDLEYPMYLYEPYSLSNFPDIPNAILSSIYYLWDHLSPYIVLRGIYLILAFLAIVTIAKSRNGTLDNTIVQVSLSAIGGQMLIMLLAISFPSSVFSPQPILLYLSFDIFIGVFAVWLCRNVLLRLSKMTGTKVNHCQSKFGFTKNSKILKVGLLAGILMYSSFVYCTVLHDPQEIRGAYGVWALTTTDDLELMLWMKDNLPRDYVILVNQYESGLFIPSISHHKIIFPRTASSFSRSYQTLSTLLENRNLNATTCNLMKHFNITHVFIGCYTSIFEMYKHKWDPQPFLQNPNFDLVRKVGNAYLFAFSYKYPEVAFQDDFEYESPAEAGWEFYVAKESEGIGFGEATISSNHAYHGRKSLMITAKRDKEGYYFCWAYKQVCVWDTSNVTLSFYLNATSGFNNDLDHSAVIVADTSWQREITISTPYANISSEYMKLPDLQGFFEFNLSEIWYQRYNSTLPNDFCICLQNFDGDGIENIVFLDYITMVCNDK